MPTAKIGEVEIFYLLSDAEGEVVLLIGGLGDQAIFWPDGFCQVLEAGALRPLRPDNRDAGLSTHFSEAPVPDLFGLYLGGEVQALYSVDDMADDMAGLLGALSIDRAHVVGLSMGGMMAQSLAIHHPRLVASLCSIMSTTGDRSVGQPHPEVIEMMVRAAPSERDQVIADDLKWHALIGSPDYPMGEQYRSSRTAAAFDRCHDPAGRVRQVAAVLAGGDRSEALGTITVPTVVIHGSADKLIDPSGGRATAAAIRGAKLVEVEGMGHDLPPSLWPLICREILANVALAKGA